MRDVVRVRYTIPSFSEVRRSSTTRFLPFARDGLESHCSASGGVLCAGYASEVVTEKRSTLTATL